MAAARQKADAMSATLSRLTADRPWISSETLGAAARAVAALREWSVPPPPESADPEFVYRASSIPEREVDLPDRGCGGFGRGPNPPPGSTLPRRNRRHVLCTSSLLSLWRRSTATVATRRPRCRSSPPCCMAFVRAPAPAPCESTAAATTGHGLCFFPLLACASCQS